VAIAGDEIIVGTGTYSETLTVDKGLTIRSATGVNTDVVITSANITITVNHSVNNVYIKDLKIVCTNTTFAAVTININRDFSVNPSGLPVLATQCDNFNLINCIVDYNKTGISMNAKNSNVLKNTFIQTGATSSHSTMLLYSVDNIAINDNTHSTMTAGLNRFIYLTAAGGGEYRKRTLQVKNNYVSVTNAASSGHFLLCETTLNDPADPTTKFRLDFQHNTHVTITSPLDTAGLVIIYPTTTTNFKNNFDYSNYSIVANNNVTNPYRAWVYFDITAAEPTGMGDTYFRIYGNTYTIGTPSYRPGSWDVDTPTANANVFLSATPVSTSGWPSVYVGTTYTFTASAPTNETDATNKLTTLMKTVYTGDTLSIPLSLFTINPADDATLIAPIVISDAMAKTSTSLAGYNVTLTSPNANYKFLFLTIANPYQATGLISFVVKVYNVLTGQILTTGINTTFNIDLGLVNAAKTILFYRYVFPNFVELVPPTEISPGVYQVTLNTNSLYTLDEEAPPPVTTSDNTWIWITAGGLLALWFLTRGGFSKKNTKS